MHKSKLIKDTTREERIAIVQEALSWGDECDGASTQAASVDKFYLPYIEGECELRELRAQRQRPRAERPFLHDVAPGHPGTQAEAPTRT